METRKPARRKRTIQKHLWFSAVEWEQVARRMRAYGLTSFSRYARELLLNGQITIMEPTTNMSDLRSSIDRIGNNVNQIAKQANTDHMATYQQVVAVRRLLTEVRELVRDDCGSHDGHYQDQRHSTDPE